MKEKQKQETLMEKVKKVQSETRTYFKVVDPDVAVAWLRGDVANCEIAKAVWPEKKTTHTVTMVYAFLNRSLREAYRQGKIKIVE